MKYPRLRLGVALVSLLILAFCACSRKEPTRPLNAVASQGSVCALSDTVIAQIQLQNNETARLDSCLTPGGGVGGVPATLPPWPDTVLGVIERAYAERDAGPIEVLLADDFEFSRSDGASWKRDTEIIIHKRMFDPQYFRYGAERLWLNLSNSEWHLLDSSVATGKPLYVVTCDVELWVDCPAASATFSAKGKTRLVVRRVETASAKWQIVHWYDNF